MENNASNCGALVIGGSAGARDVLDQLLGALPADFPLAVAVVLHLHAHSDAAELAESLNGHTALSVVEAVDKQPLTPGRVSLAPANYHLLVEPGPRLALNIDAKVHYSRPSIDVLFETAAEIFCERLIGLLLSGASTDGVRGLERIRALGGETLVQDPASAAYPVMPQAAVDQGVAEKVLLPSSIGAWLCERTSQFSGYNRP